MGVIIDLTGQKFGHWLVIDRGPNSLPRVHSGRSRWWCQCQCEECDGEVRLILTDSLRNGKSQSCGSRQRWAVRDRQTTHGQAAARTPTYNSWNAMTGRCLFPRDSSYRYYGGRGITVCNRWLGTDGFANFLADMGERPPGKTLDRIDVNGNYEPSNCRWATLIEQRANRRDSREAASA